MIIKSNTDINAEAEHEHIESMGVIKLKITRLQMHGLNIVALDVF